MKIISSVCVFSVYVFLLCVAIFAIRGMIVKAEDLTTSNLTPNMSGMTASSGTSFGTGHGCSQGKYCTSGTNEGGGTYTSTFDVPLTEAELRQGFTLNSGITINSHSSNSRLPTCANGLLQSGDCRDMFKLTITLKDGATTVETFVHQEELDWTGIKNFTYSDTVASNDYGVLSGVLSLYGIDAGYPVGYYGPQFSNPSLTIDYQTALVIEDTTTVINDVIQTDTETTIMDAATGGTDTPITIASVASTIATPVTYTSISIDPPATAPVTVTAPTTAPVAETSIEAPTVEPTAPAAPTIAPIAEPSETQTEQTNEAEAKIEAKIKQPKAKASSKTKVQATTNSPAVNVSVPVTPAVAAQTVVNNIAPSQKYGGTAQTVTLVAMGMIADNRQIFKGATIPDAPNFFSSSSVPDGPSMVDIANNYSFIGQSNTAHDALVESQWSK